LIQAEFFGGVENNDERPSGNWTAFLSRENSSNGGSKNHQNFLEKILWAAERQCQGIFPE
jgi:hypothetical protein